MNAARGDDAKRSVAETEHQDGSLLMTQVHFEQLNSMDNLMRRVMQFKMNNQSQLIDFIGFASDGFAVG
jgi:hypothetical protein